MRTPRSRLQALCAAFLFFPLSAVASFCEPVVEESTAGATVLGNGTPGSISTAQLQTAMDAGGVIRLDQGAAPSTLTVTSTLEIDRNVVLDGGGLVTLSGGGARRILSIVNPNPAADAPQIHVTLQNIGFVDASGGDRGGAIYKEHDYEYPHKVNLKLVNCEFHDNVAPLDGSSQDDGGGAFYGELLNRIDIGNCRFENNSGSNGGAVYSLGSLRLNIVDSVFERNHATGSGGNPGSGGNAGALGVDGPGRLVDVCRTRFVDNGSNAYGAGFFSVMYDAQSRTRFEDVEFRGNVQLSSGQHSGGAYIQGGPWAMERVSFIDNEARGYGGLFVAGNAPGTIRNGTFSGNVARTGLGGAMGLSSDAPITIVNTTIANNVATDAFAGGIAIGAGNQLRLANTVFANNSGGNIYVNWAMNNPAAFDGGGNLQWPRQRTGGGGAETAVTASATFVDAQIPAVATDNGGHVPTLALPAGSAARDAGVASVSGSTVAVPAADARGSPRFGAVDSGSFEYPDPNWLFLDGFE
ncbi:MAG: right-handed parallel beta-helix repeat-containing protein [Xanthomonadales bacterium]|nr:right-handed parallel beta-helix repeat-containing protein [Xanthomonadales bacterium]